MKKSLALLCVLLLLGLGTAGAAMVDTANTAKQVKTQSVLQGQDWLAEQKNVTWSAAAGTDSVQDLNLQFQVQYNDRLLWDLDLWPAQQPEHPKTEFVMLPRAKNYNETQKEQRVELNNSMGFTAGTSGGSFDLGSDADTYGLGPAFQDVSSRAPAGQKYTETVKLKKYFETWPMLMELDTAGVWLHWQEMVDMRTQQLQTTPFVQGAYALAEHLLQSFQFPIQGDPQMEITLEKDETGAVIGLEAYTNNQQQNADFISTFQTRINNRQYLVVEARQADGSLMDYGLTPHGYGIYTLPIYEEKDYTLPVNEEKDCPSPQDLQFLCPLEPQEQLVLMTNDGTNLLLVTQKEQQKYLNALDPSGKPLYRLALEQPFDVDWLQICTQDDLVLVLAHGAEPARHDFMLLQRNPDKGYQVKLQNRLPGSKAFESLLMPSDFQGLSLAFDGQRLAMAAPYGRDHNGDCGYSVLVYDSQGLVFADARQTSLSQPSVQTYSQACHVVPKSVTVRFAGQQNPE